MAAKVVKSMKSDISSWFLDEKLEKQTEQQWIRIWTVVQTKKGNKADQWVSELYVMSKPDGWTLVDQRDLSVVWSPHRSLRAVLHELYKVRWGISTGWAARAFPSSIVPRSLGYFPWSSLDDGTPRVLDARRSQASGKGKKAVKSAAKSVTADDDEEHDAQSHPNPRGGKNTVSFVAETLLPTLRGKYRIRVYRDWAKSERECEIMCIIHGKVEGKKDVVVRVHDQCFTSEVLGSLKCDCREQLEYAMEYIRTDKNFPELCPKRQSEHDEGHTHAVEEIHQQWTSCPVHEEGKNAMGMIIYMPQEGRGIGLANKIKAYSMQELGLDTVDANRALGFADDLREYGAVPLILAELGIPSIRLLTNNPRKVEELRKLGVNITDRIPVHIDANPFSSGYLQAKHMRMGHMMREGKEPAEVAPERAGKWNTKSQTRVDQVQGVRVL